MIFIGPGDFTAIGEEFLGYFKSLGGLQPHERVLDVGCGIGRMAIPLTRYLDPRGSYEGFDIVGEGISWCQKRITPRFSRFRFLHADVYNGLYNPKGRFRAKDYAFPYDDASFDFVFLTSVFTHMVPTDMESYLAQVARVLKPGGRCLVTFFLTSDETKDLMARGLSSLPMKDVADGSYSAIDNGTPEYDIAFPERQVREVYARRGLAIDGPIHYGNWCGRTKALSYQDIVVARK
jgi:SAM-dependent methyltransferase